MPKRCIQSDDAPPALGPYSHAVVAGDFVFLSGQGPFAPDGSGVRRGTLEEETRLTFSNIKAVLESAGAGFENVVKVLVFLSDMDKFAEFNKYYKEYFPSDCPARSCIQAGRLPGDIQVEIEVVAMLSGE